MHQKSTVEWEIYSTSNFWRQNCFHLNIYIFFILINKYKNQHTKNEKNRCTVSNKVHVYVQINNVDYTSILVHNWDILCVRSTFRQRPTYFPRIR